MVVGVYMVLNKKVEVVKIVEVEVDTKKVPSSQNDQTNCEFETHCYLFVLYLYCLGK